MKFQSQRRRLGLWSVWKCHRPYNYGGSEGFIRGQLDLSLLQGVLPLSHGLKPLRRK
jgi:hypothetical protein